jgi:hypothetical protein
MACVFVVFQVLLSASAPPATPPPEPTPARPTQTARPAAAATSRATAVSTPAATAALEPTAPPAPTATPPPPIGLEPAPGTLTIAEYEPAVAPLRELLFETFDRGERTKGIWSQGENENIAARLRDNFYALTLKGENKALWETTDDQLGDSYNVELSIAFETTGVPAGVGIAYDVQEGDNGVFFEVFNDQTWQLRTVQDGVVLPERSTGRIPFDGLIGGVATNVLWVVRGPQETQLWINSIHVATVPSGPFPGGRAGVAASSRQGLAGEATVIVDNFRIRAP